jgi:hypothetical protein
LGCLFFEYHRRISRWWFFFCCRRAFVRGLLGGVSFAGYFCVRGCFGGLFLCCRFVSAFGGCLVVFSFAVDLFLRSVLFGGGPALSHIFLFLLTESHAAKLQI